MTVLQRITHAGQIIFQSCADSKLRLSETPASSPLPFPLPILRAAEATHSFCRCDSTSASHHHTSTLASGMRASCPLHLPPPSHMPAATRSRPINAVPREAAIVGGSRDRGEIRRGEIRRGVREIDETRGWLGGVWVWVCLCLLFAASSSSATKGAHGSSTRFCFIRQRSEE
jgi:hypothetical protein